MRDTRSRGRAVLVAGGVAVAITSIGCGDDSMAGTGGAGGSSGATTSSSTSTSSVATTSSSTTSTSSSSGGSGGGGGDPAGTGGGSAACAEVAGPGAAIVVVTVDENGDEVPARRVAWQDQPADAFWLDATDATCAGGAEPPCSRWEIATSPSDRIAITAERETEADATEACLPYASTFVEVHPPIEGERQLVHLTLPTYGTYCIGDAGVAIINVDHDEELGDDDCLTPPEAIDGPIVVSVVDEAGEPVPASTATWYYPPKGPDYDGEHPLRCVDPRCTTWVVEEAPAAGTIYLTATYAGPLSPFFQQGWAGFGAGSFEVEVDGEGVITPISAVLAVDTLLEGAIGG